MKVYLTQNVPKVGMAGEIINVSDGYAANFLLPRKLGVKLTPENEAFYKGKVVQVAHRKEVIETETSMVAEKIKATEVKLKCKVHDDGKLYGAISQHEIVDALQEKGITIAKSQVVFDKSIKKTGTHTVTIKISSRLQPQLTVKVVGE
ncbi:MAG: 50S ribosomal protein L9 [Candidatus Babeliales bacterium]